MCGMHKGEVGPPCCRQYNYARVERKNYLSVKDAAGRIHPVTYVTEAWRVRDSRETGEGQKSCR